MLIPNKHSLHYSASSSPWHRVRELRKRNSWYCLRFALHARAQIWCCRPSGMSKLVVGWPMAAMDTRNHKSSALDRLRVMITNSTHWLLNKRTYLVNDFEIHLFSQWKTERSKRSETSKKRSQIGQTELGECTQQSTLPTIPLLPCNPSTHMCVHFEWPRPSFPPNPERNAPRNRIVAQRHPSFQWPLSCVSPLRTTARSFLLWETVAPDLTYWWW